jgi:hypothetical protein
MTAFDPAASFGPDVAARYDDEHRLGDEAETVALLAELCAGRPALEFAVGTGRIALPLAQRTSRVDGIELSPAMAEQLRAKLGSDAVTVSLGDMATTRLPDRYGVVYLVFNTIFNIVTQDGQVRCFENARAHLADGGVFVVETAVPTAWTHAASYVRPEQVDPGRVTLDVCSYDPVTQLFRENHVEVSGDGIRFSPIACRLAGTGELDLMARIAGLTLLHRWGGWTREPFTASSVRHVSVYGVAG